MALLDRIQVAQCGVGLTVVRTCPEVGEERYGDGHENGDDEHDDHDLDEGEAIFVAPKSGPPH